MFVYYLDACLTVYWKLFGLSLLLIGFLGISIYGTKLLRTGAHNRALKEAHITGAMFEKLRARPGRRLRDLALACGLTAAILTGYVSFFSDFVCSEESFLWIAPHFDSGD